MCGVAGIVNLNGKGNNDVAVVTAMLSAIRHRGPDESGIYASEKAVIGNVRLSIIDIASGKQPLSTSDGNMWIVFNGEIFNYIELREELLNLGHKFQTSSDTEVLLKIYQQFGPAGLSKLNGQFVFAVWDKKREELFIARDRVGIRPLYYTRTGNTFVFGSEIKALLQHPGVSADPDPKSLSQLFTFWTMLPGSSFFTGINELKPGHYMILSKGELTIRKFWELEFAAPGNYITHNFEEACAEFHDLLADAVKLRLRSDVPVGAYLSGGLDSSVITSLVNEVSPQNLETYSLRFADADYDESGYQKEVSDYFKTRHVSVTCTSNDIADIFPEVIWYSESALFRTAPAPMYLLSKKVRSSNVKVVLTGEGADEILAGYDIFKELQIRSFWAANPNSKIRPLLLKRLYPYIPQINSMNAQMLKFVFGYKLSETDHPFYAFLLRWNNGSFIRNYLSAENQQMLAGYDVMAEAEQMLPDQFKSWDPMSRAQWVESKLLMSNYLLSSQGDRMIMANSVEGRYPFLDYRVIEYAAKLPPQFKIKGLNEKYLLKKTMAGRLPQSVLNRSKQPYRAPIRSVFMGDKKPDYVSKYMDQAMLKRYGLFDTEKVSKLLQKFETGTVSENDTIALTAILSSQLFYAIFVEKSLTPVSYDNLLSPRIINDYHN